MNNKLLKILAIVFAAAVVYVAFLEKQSYHATKIMEMIHGKNNRNEVLTAGRKGCRSLFDDDYLGI